MINALIYVYNPFKYLRENYISPRHTSEIYLADFSEPEIKTLSLLDLRLLKFSES